MLDQAFEALKTYDWGVDPNVLAPIDEAIVATHGDEKARRDLEDRLAAVLAADAPFDAKDYVCRALMIVGSAASVPALAALLPDAKLSHMGRYALERIPAPEAAKALRDSIPDLTSELQIGVISSLGARGDEASVPLLARLLASSDASVACAAACALGAIRNPAAAKALTAAEAGSPEVAAAVADASLACAESLLAHGKKVEALAIYKGLAGDDQPKQVKLAATRGLLAAAGASQ